jgi:hypothetical protein
MPDSLSQVYTAFGNWMPRSISDPERSIFIEVFVHRLRMIAATPEGLLKFAAGAELRRQKT